MAKDLLGASDKKLTLTCPKCGKKFQETLGRLDGNNEFRCPNCALLFKPDKPVSIISSVDEALKKAGKAFKKRGSD